MTTFAQARRDAPPRFYVRTSTGYSFKRDLTRGNLLTHHSILDRAYCHREVGRFGTKHSHTAWSHAPTVAEALDAAERRAAELNAWNEAA